MAAISGQFDLSSIIVSVQIWTVFACILAPSSASLNLYWTFHGPHRSTESSSQGLITLSSRSGSFPSFTTFVGFISLYVSHVPVISLQRLSIPGHVKLARTLSSSLLAPGFLSASWYHSRIFFVVTTEVKFYFVRPVLFLSRVVFFRNLRSCNFYKLKASLGTAFFSQVVGQLGFSRNISVMTNVIAPVIFRCSSLLK